MIVVAAATAGIMAGPTTEVAPIRKAVTVRSGREHTFDVFVRRIGHWWPAQPYSLGAEKVQSVHVEPQAGGRVYETWHDGTRCDWGEVVVWEPPERFAMTWEATAGVPGGATTEVELRFLELGPSLTRVELEHRHWERLTAEARASVTTVEGGYPRGWEIALAALAEAAET